jgi:hypothetical protein
MALARLNLRLRSSSWLGKTSKDARLVCLTLSFRIFSLSFFLFWTQVILDFPLFSIQISRNMCPGKDEKLIGLRIYCVLFSLRHNKNHAGTTICTCVTVMDDHDG